MSPRPKSGVRKDQKERDREREALERRFADQLEDRPDLAREFTAETARREAFHRWTSYRQGFAPALVRRFLAEARPGPEPLLDPFSGSGTFVLECARAGRFALGTETAPGLAVLSAAPFLPGEPRSFGADGKGTLEDLMAAAQSPMERALVLALAAEQKDGEGHEREPQGDPRWRLEELAGIWRQDLATPLETSGGILRADARALPLATQSLGGVLTSPPYISRYDYSRVNAPINRLLGFGKKRGRGHQLRASKGFAPKEQKPAPHEAAEEAALELSGAEHFVEAAMVRNYFRDLAQCFAELARTLRRDSPLWLVIGAAAPRRVYVPSDLIAAELLERAGFTIEALLLGRHLHGSGRSLGTLKGIAPRETLVCVRRSPSPQTSR